MTEDETDFQQEHGYGQKIRQELAGNDGRETPAVDETLLDKKSRKHLDIERRKRSFKSDADRAGEDRRRFNATTLVAVASLVLALIGYLFFAS